MGSNSGARACTTGERAGRDKQYGARKRSTNFGIGKKLGARDHLITLSKPIRLPMARAAFLADQIPQNLSFKHTVQIWLSWQLRGCATHDAVSMSALLVLIAEPRVELRPGRMEPRALKRRTKPFPLLTKPR